MALVLVVTLWAGTAGATCTAVDHTHAAWTAILARWVDDGRVDYAGLERDGQPALTAYLATLSGACRADYDRWTPAQRIAFWVNAYNAFTIRLILDHYPIASIRKIGFLPGAAFRERFIAMDGLKGGPISLDDIENGTLRSTFREPRIHFALVCASRSCPALRAEAYRGADLDRQLDDQARRFLNDPTKNRLDRPARILELSSIFKWFREDFERAAESLPAYVGRYLGGDAALDTYTVRFLDYDWTLNDRVGASR
jgi:hypothetical protein